MKTFTRRGGLIGAAAGLGVLGAGLPASAQTEASGLEVQSGDYRQARAGFRTQFTRITASPQRNPMPAAPADVTVETYMSGKLRLAAWVGLPPGAKGRLPVVIFLHGGFAFGADDFDMARPYLAAGYAVVTPILRGEDGLPGVFSLFYDEVDDVLAATEHVAAQPYADPSRIFLAGHSVGGTMTMLSAMASDRYRAATAFSGSPDQILFLRPEPGLIPFDANDPREFLMRSPLAWPASFKCPTRLFYGSKEGFFHLTTPRLAQLAKAAGRDVESTIFAGDHFGAVPAETAASIAFFRQHG